MKKRECLNRYFELTKDFSKLNNRLSKLVDEDKITTGAAYYVYNPFRFYYYERISDILTKASKSTNYTRYLKRIDKYTWNSLIIGLEKELEEAYIFVEEQEKLPIELSQKGMLENDR